MIADFVRLNLTCFEYSFSNFFFACWFRCEGANFITGWGMCGLQFICKHVLLLALCWYFFFPLLSYVVSPIDILSSHPPMITYIDQGCIFLNDDSASSRKQARNLPFICCWLDSVAFQSNTCLQTCSGGASYAFWIKNLVPWFLISVWVLKRLFLWFSALPPPLQAGTFSRGVVTMRCDLSTSSSAHISLLVSGSAQTCFDDQVMHCNFYKYCGWNCLYVGSWFFLFFLAELGWCSTYSYSYWKII